MTEETNEVIVNIADVISKEYEGQPTRLKLEVTEDNIFTGKTEVLSVALTESESLEGKDFKRDKLEKAFETISNYTGVELEVPKSISKTSVANALKPVKGKSLEVYIGTGVNKNRNDVEAGTYTYHSLYEPSDGFEYLTANSKISDLMAMDDRFKKGTVFTVKPIGFQGEINNKYFQDGQPFDAEMLEESKTRIGFARALYKILKNDENDLAKNIQKRLTDYIKQNEIDGDFVGTTGGIIQQVGVFSDQSKNAKKLDEITVMNLEKTLSPQKRTGRAYTGTVRLIFEVDGFEGKTFKSRPLKEAKIPLSETFVTTFNPEDTNFMEFSKFTEPLYRLGALTMDDLKEIKGMDKWYDIMNKIQNIIIENNLVAKVSIDTVSDNYFVNLIGFEYNDSEGSDDEPSIEKEGDTLEQNAKEQASKEQEKVEEPQETPKEEAPKEDAKKDNPFEKGLDISDDDLPF